MSLKNINRGLLVAIIVVNLYVIGLPVYAVAGFWWQKHIQHRPQQLVQLIKSIPAKPPKSDGERLIIPSIAVDYNVLEGQSVHTVDKGIWHWPKGASPGQTGNTVLIGHRFTYHGGDALTHLDLVRLGDNITLIWNGHKFNYTVKDIKVVNPSDTSIIQPSSDKRLTIYTCTPMWTSKMRLVVIAQEGQG